MSYWKYKNLSLFAYGQKDRNRDRDTPTAAPEYETRQALSDWNRWANSGTTCPIYINGKSLTMLLSEEEKPGFQNEEELLDFFKRHLFSKPDYTDEVRSSLSYAALVHFHQAGYPFATNFCINNTNSGDTRASEPISRIDFNDTENGLVIKEQQTYKELISIKTGKKNVITDSEKYHARTITTSIMNTDGITLTDLEIDCPSRSATPIFDKRGLWDKICEYLINVLVDFKSFQGEQETIQPSPK